MRYPSRFLHGLCLLVALGAAALAAEPTLKDTMDGIVTRAYGTLDATERAQLDDAAVEAFITPEERNVLATKYWYFDVNVPVVVSILHETGQPVAPFWLEEGGFVKTEMTATNMEDWVFEIWQKKCDAGRVELGINGFDKHRQHYLVGVGAQSPGASLAITHLFPEQYKIVTLEPGATCYNDWSELRLREVPEAITGHQLLTTVRGRAREAHLIGAFRTTPFPSSPVPDQVVLTWSEDPRTTQTVQWRTNMTVEDGVVRYRPRTATEFTEVAAEPVVIEDRLLANDRYIHHFTAVIRELEPGTTYDYIVGSPTADTWSAYSEFITAPDDDAPFTFISFGDTHRSPEWGEVLTAAYEQHPHAAFYAIAGDVVGTGLHRDDWDHFLAYSQHVFGRRPIALTIGNHDDQDGLGCRMLLDLFSFPMDGPDTIEKERSYTFEYGNALIIGLDVTSEIGDQTAWLEDQSRNSDATWKFAVFHFPPYVTVDDFDLDYGEIREEWGPVFDKYHVDMVMTGHVHHYMRTHPIRDGQVMDSPADGTIYVISIGIPGRRARQMPMKDFSAIAFRDEGLYQTFDIDGDTLIYRSYGKAGNVRDELIIEK